MNNDYNQQQYPMVPQPGKGMATASLVCSILSVVFFILHIFLWFLIFPAIIGLILGIVAVVTAVLAKKKGVIGGTATAGLVMGIIGTAMNGIIFICCLACFGAACSTANAVNSSANQIANDINNLLR